MIAQIDRLRVTGFWSSVWTEVLRSEATPTLQFKAINELACNGQTIHYVPFVSRQGGRTSARSTSPRSIPCARP